MAKKGILVTGGTGLVGAYAVGMLLERGERPVVFDIALNERLLNAVGVDVGRVTMIRGDMMDLPALISAIRDNEVDRIIHLAGRDLGHQRPGHGQRVGGRSLGKGIPGYLPQFRNGLPRLYRRGAQADR